MFAREGVSEEVLKREKVAQCKTGVEIDSKNAVKQKECEPVWRNTHMLKNYTHTHTQISPNRP